MPKRIFLITFFALAACTPDGPHRPLQGTLTGKSGPLSYQDVKPIFAQFCSGCHPSRSAPDWLDYGSAKPVIDAGKLKRRLIDEKSMPPPGSPQAVAITDNERNKVAAWIQAGAPLDSSAPSSGAPAAKVQAGTAERCFQCHGAAGPGSDTQAKIPRLAGQNEEYLATQLNKFKWRERIDPSNAMNDVAADLRGSEITEVAKYFANLPEIPAKARHELSAGDRGIYETGKKYAEENCVSCHMNAENGYRPIDVTVPVIAGQSKQYLINQLLDFRRDEHRSDLMHEFAKALSNQDIEALATYFSAAESGKPPR